MKTSPFTRWYIRCAVLALLLLATTSTSAAPLLTNGDFEDEPNFVPGNSIAVLSGSELPGWTIEPGHFLTIHDNSVFPTISGTYSANTDGEGQNGVNADFYQDFPAANAGPYQLTFDWEGWLFDPTAVLNVSIQDLTTSALLVNDFYVGDPTLTVHSIAANFTGTGNLLRLRVQENPQSGVNDNAFIVDNFSVALVPEPSTLVLALASFAGAGYVTFWKKYRRV
jgi:Protein of unknown function (DUF642)